MADIRELIRWRREGMSQRAAAEALGLARNTVAGYEREARKRGWLDASNPMPDEGAVAHMLKEMFAPTAQTLSKLAPQREWITAERAAGSSIAKVHRDLTTVRQVKCAYAAVWGYVRQMEGRAADVTVRVETAPGEEAQVDFGYAGRMYDPVKKGLRKAWLFVMTLSYSRHMFVKFVFDQTTPTWLRLHREGFEFFGGTPRRIKLDNLKAAIIRASIEDPIVQKSYRELAEYYGFLIAPCRVRKPQHKGKVEAGVKFTKSAFLSGTQSDYTREDRHIGHANQDVRAWVLKAAGERIHGTTRWQPVKEYERIERQAMQPLPSTPYDIATWTRAKVHRDCYIVLDGCYYSAPFRFVGEELDVRVSDTDVKLHIHHEHIATHTRVSEPGKRQTNDAHLPEYKLLGMRTGPMLRDQAAQIGPYTAVLVNALLDCRPIDKTAVAQRLIGLSRKHNGVALEHACKRAVECGDPTPQTVRNMIALITSGKWVSDDDAADGSARGAQSAPMFARSIEDMAPAHALTALTNRVSEVCRHDRTEVAA